MQISSSDTILLELTPSLQLHLSAVQKCVCIIIIIIVK